MKKSYLLIQKLIVILFLSYSVCFAQSIITTANPDFLNTKSSRNNVSLTGKVPSNLNKHSGVHLTVINCSAKKTNYFKKNSSRRVYCYVTYDPTGKLPNGPAYFYIDNPDSIISLANQSISNFIFGGTWGGGNKWYGNVYGDNNLVTIDTVTGTRTILGPTQSGITGLSYDYKTETLFGMAYDGNEYSSLYKINAINGKAQLIGQSIAGTLINMACDTSGNLYSMNLTDSSFYSINKNTGLATKIGYVGFKPNYAQSMTFDMNTNTCYMSAYNNDSKSGEFRTVNLKTGMTTLIQTLQGGSEITGLAIPYNFSPKNTDVAAVTEDVPLFINPKPIMPIATVLNNGKASRFAVTMNISVQGTHQRIQ